MPAEKIPGWIERLLLPKLSELKGEMMAVHAEIKSLRTEMDVKFEGLNYRFDAANTRFDSLEKSILDNPYLD
ncbi:MAG: hypothetical protein OIN88_09380 [Candidatus Methanoperedens sp.]|nr:hypothetical protein [Candidatus Methanoperedens sp.]MCZ7360206.1 hypothetical protein [Candidatus Methanoperedens sp.]